MLIRYPRVQFFADPFQTLFQRSLHSGSIPESPKVCPSQLGLLIPTEDQRKPVSITTRSPLQTGRRYRPDFESTGTPAMYPDTPR